MSVALGPAGVRLYANFGGEEGDARPQPPTRAVLQNLLAAWSKIFTPGHAFADVAAGGHLAAWLNTPSARAEAAKLGRPLFGADPGVVDVVHDKAFCVDVVRRHHLLPEIVQNDITVLDPAEVTVEALTAAIDKPSWSPTGSSFTFKPRFGSSGRGRVDSRRAHTEWAAALERLQNRGGVVVERWLDRVLDLSALWRIHDDGRIALLGTTTALVNKSGLWEGAELVIDDDGVPRSCMADRVSVWDRQLVDESFFVVEAAARAGYHGPCGVDAFVFNGPRGVPLLRLVELNARFTAGLVAVVLASGPGEPGGHRIFRPATSPALFSRSAPASG
ncbi:MAG: hypothetical protein Q8O67_02340 [Deltaproteobacteria bacterium]|nr:hypothetical protein [Deltaproteobacteria bacterium]